MVTKKNFQSLLSELAELYEMIYVLILWKTLSFFVGSFKRGDPESTPGENYPVNNPFVSR